MFKTIFVCFSWAINPPALNLKMLEYVFYPPLAEVNNNQLFLLFFWGGGATHHIPQKGKAKDAVISFSIQFWNM